MGKITLTKARAAVSAGILVSFALCAALCAATFQTTLAYYTAEDSISNEMGVAVVGVEGDAAQEPASSSATSWD